MKNLIKQDYKAKTTSFFLLKEGEKIDQKYISFLKKSYGKNKKDIRLCLHKNPKAKHHDMIILQQRKNFYTPHKHLKKGETYHIIQGSMACVLLNNSGKITKVCRLKKNEIFRTPLNIFHTMLPITKYVIYHESKTGPFLKKNDSIYPKWGKKLISDKRLIEKFKKTIYKHIN